MQDVSANRPPANSELNSTSFREQARSHLVFEFSERAPVTISPELVCCVSAPVTAVSWVPTAAVVFALVATLPLSLPLVGPRSLPLSPVSSMTSCSLVFVFLCREVIGAALSLSLPFPLSVPVPLYFHRSAGPWPRSWALPLVAGSSAVAVTTAGLGVTVAVVAGLGLEVGEEGWGLMSPRRQTATVRARTWARTVGPRATASAVVTVEAREKRKMRKTSSQIHL